MEHFIVSARKYRPSSFEDVVGQRAITSTLENAIANNHLAQALLFTGPRGVGKTTCARILAKRINQDGDEAQNEDFAFNIFELDAASNNSVDDIRNLIDQVRIPPQVGKYKVYIIDEVHMLSQSAFNAFLKTLEEPPKHAIFILATTEKHKIIPTILSRCQIFDFKRITVLDIKEQLARVAAAEGIEAEDDALHIIAQKADGAMRDALSIFDRVVSFAGKQLSRQAVAQNLNILDYTHYFKVTDLILKNDIPGLLLAFNDILSSGFDAHNFITGLASHFRDLLVCQKPETIPLLEVGASVQKMYADQAQIAPASFLVEAIALASECDLQFKSSRNQRLLVELCLMQLASLTFNQQKKKTDLDVAVVPPSYFREHDKQSSATPIKQKTAVSDKQAPPATALPDMLERPASSMNTKNAETEGSDSSTLEPPPAKPTEPRRSPEQKLAERNARKVSALSLKSIERKRQIQKELVAAQQDTQSLPEEAFTEVEMRAAWDEYARKLKKKGRFNLLSHLTMGEPSLEGNLIHLVFPNDTIRVEVERAKPALLGFLKKKLNNYAVDLSIEVNEQETKRYAYTTREKFELLREKNPLIDKLRKEFDLDL